MNLSEMILEVWQQLGEPSDIDPTTGGVVDIATAGALTLQSAINEAQNVIGAWKFPNGVRIRFRELEDEVFFTAPLVEGTSDAGQASPYKVVTLPINDTTAPDGRFNGWVIVINNEAHFIVSHMADATTSTLNLATPFTFDPSSLAFDLVKARFSFVASSDPLASDNIAFDKNVVEVISVENVTAGAALDYADPQDSYLSALNAAGDPGSFKKYQRSIWMNSAPDEEQTFRVLLYRNVSALSALTDECELPEQFHYAVILRTLWWGAHRMQENDMAYSYKRDLDDLMIRLRTAYDFESEKHDAFFKVRSL